MSLRSDLIPINRSSWITPKSLMPGSLRLRLAMTVDSGNPSHSSSNDLQLSPLRTSGVPFQEESFLSLEIISPILNLKQNGGTILAISNPWIG